MKDKSALQALSGIDDKFIEETAVRRPKGTVIKWCAAAACFCLTAAGAAALWFSPGKDALNGSPGSGISSETYVVEEEDIAAGDTAGGTSSTTSAFEVYEIPDWEERSIVEKFPSIPLNGVNYDAADTLVPADKTGNLIASAVLTGYDEQAGISHSINAAIYEIKGVSSVCAAAVKYEGYDGFYVCRNAYYRPETLGQFITDLNLRENLTFGKAYGTVKKDENRYADMEYTGLQPEKIWEMLFGGETLKNVESFDSMNFEPDLISISISLELLGYKNISLAVTGDGYLTTNILDTGKAFFIGTDKAREFTAYVRGSCEATETHEYVIAESEPQASGGGSASYAGRSDSSETASSATAGS